MEVVETAYWEDHLVPGMLIKVWSSSFHLLSTAQSFQMQDPSNMNGPEISCQRVYICDLAFGLIYMQTSARVVMHIRKCRYTLFLYYVSRNRVLEVIPGAYDGVEKRVKE